MVQLFFAFCLLRVHYVYTVVRASHFALHFCTLSVRFVFTLGLPLFAYPCMLRLALRGVLGHLTTYFVSSTSHFPGPLCHSLGSRSLGVAGWVGFHVAQALLSNLTHLRRSRAPSLGLTAIIAGFAHRQTQINMICPPFRAAKNTPNPIYPPVTTSAPVSTSCVQGPAYLQS